MPSRLETRSNLATRVRKKGLVLLVGEQVHYVPGEIHRPWCVDRGCSGWLLRLLDEADIPEERLVWANARDEWGRSVDLRKLVGTLEPSRIIAMGSVAREALTKAGRPHHDYVPHPQFWMRFGRGQPYVLIKILKNHFGDPNA